MTLDQIRLTLPDRILAEIGRTTAVRVRVTELAGVDRKVLVRALGNLDGPLPTTEVDVAAGESQRTEVAVSIPHGMPPGEHQYLFEVVDRDNGRVLASVDATVDIQHTRSVSMTVQPQSIRKRMRGKVRVVVRNHDDEPHKIRLRAEGDDGDTRVSLERPGIIIRPGEMVRVPARVKVKPYYIGKQKERFYSIIGEGAGVPVYARGNVRQKPMIGKNVKSLGLLGSIVIVWLTLTIAVIRLVSPATEEAAVGAQTGTEQPGEGETPVSPLVPVLVDVTGTVTAVPDGSEVVIAWRPISIGDSPDTQGKVAGGSVPNNPDVALQTTTTDADGKFVVAGLDGAGLFEFSFSKAGHQTQTKIVQPNGQAVTLEVALTPGSGVIGGTAVDDAGRPLGGVDITLTDGAITYGASTPNDGDSAGRFRFTNLSSPGTYVLDAKIPGRGLASATIELTSGQAIEDIKLVLSTNVTALAGRIGAAAFEGGTVAPNDTRISQSSLAARLPTFTVTATDGTLTRSTTTLSEALLAGTFRIEQLPVNRTYTVTYEAPGFLTYTEQLELKIDTPERQIAMTRSTGRLRGKVTIEGSNLSPTAVAVTVANPDNTYKATDAISSDGSLLIDGIEPGRYVVLFEALGLQSQAREVTIGAGTSTVLDVTISAVPVKSKGSSLSFAVVKDGLDGDTTPVTATVMYRSENDCGTEGKDTGCVYEVGDDGDLVIDGLEAGGYVILFEAEGFADKMTSAQVAALTAAPEQEVVITPLGSLQGMVSDDTSIPLQGITVVLSLDGDEVAEEVTNDKGEFLFSRKLVADEYSVDIRSDSFESTPRSVVGALSATLNVDLTVRGLSLITGEVQRFDVSSGEFGPVPTSRFAVFRRTGAADWVDATSLGLAKSLGGYRLGVENTVPTPDELLEGETERDPYSVCVVLLAEDDDSFEDLLGFITDPANAHPCDVPSDRFQSRNASAIRLQLTEVATRSAFFSPEPGAVSGVVTVSGDPQENVRVEARRIDATGRIIESASTLTNPDGEFAFTNLTPVRAADDPPTSPCDTSDGACWLIRASVENVGYDDSPYLEIRPGEQIELVGDNSLNVELATESTIVVTVRDTSGNAIPTATVSVGSFTCSPPLAGGRCSVSDPPVGDEVEIVATDDNHRTSRTTVGVGAGTTAVTVTMTPVVTLNVTVVDEDATPVVGASVTVVDSSGTSHTCPGTDAEGLCAVSDVTRGPALIDASAASIGSTSIAVAVSSSPTAATVQLASDRSTVTGTVTDADTGAPISSAVVRLTQASGRVLSTTTNSLGKIYFANVPVGSWSLELSATGYTTPSPVPLSITAGTFPIESEDTQLTSIAVTSLQGTVESSGTPVPGALITLTKDGEVRSAITNGSGVYLLTNLSAGDWQLEVFAPGYEDFLLASVTLVLGSNEQDVEVTARNGALRVSALLSSGAAVSGVGVEIFQGVASIATQAGDDLDGEDDGVFTFSDLPAGQYRVVVSDTLTPARYPEISFTVNIDRGFTTQIPVYLGSTLSSVVIGFAGIPAPGFGPQNPLALSVSLEDPDTGVTVDAVPTIGFFDRSVATFVNIPDGAYDVLISGDGAPGADVQFTISGSTWVVPDTDPIDVDGPTSVDAGLILLSLKTVDVGVTAATDCTDPTTSISSFTATVRDGYLLSPRSASATTGTADFNGLTPGTYEVEISVTGYSEVVTELDVDDWSVEPSQSACVEVYESGGLVPLVVTVQSGGTDLSGATVLIEELGVSCRSNSDGQCTVYVPPGQYDITAEKTSYGTVTGEDVTVGLTGGSATVSLTTTATTIVFEAYEEDGTAVTGFSVDSVTDAEQCSDDNSDGDCVITGLDTDPRVYEITKTGFETVFVGATAVEGSELRVPVVLSPSPTATDSLRVHALNASTGAVITDFDVYNDADGTVLCAELASDSDGNNWCDAGSTVDFGSVTLRIESTDFIDAFVTVTVTEETDSVLYVALVPVEEAPSDPELLLTITSSRTGDAISGATVSVTGLDSGSPSTCGLAGSSGTTDASGRCLVTTTNASNDEITVTISKTTGDTYRSTSVIVAMTPGQNNVVAVDMVPTGALTINTPVASAGGRAVTVVGIGVVCTVAEAATSCTSSTAIPFGTWKVTSSGLTPATVSITDFTGNSVTMTT